LSFLTEMHDFPIGNFQFDTLPEPILWIPELLANKTVQSVHLADQIRLLSQTMSYIGTQPDIPDEFEGLQDEEAPTTPPTIRSKGIRGRKEKSGAPPSAPPPVELVECDAAVRYYLPLFLSPITQFRSSASVAFLMAIRVCENYVLPASCVAFAAPSCARVAVLRLKVR
jgi:hypothetical protein